ncbi:hypothetical protein [Microbacterium sp. T32]|uniref:hypothetical protein n=1 Tax=Microbacterium sp. T32 TaxID=1776083 RepID=UPI0007AB8A13|nr:hypothetical protein [Microbacterium sp. T32]KZE41408.1 hypothetical protein AVW09_02130 [Microbacterium sp. T32]
MVDFSKLSPDVRDVPAPPGSDNAALLALPQQRTYTHDLKGKLLYFPRTDQVMVPFAMTSDGGWYVVVVFNGERAPRHDGTDGRQAGTPVYPAGGYSLYVSPLEMQTAIELTGEQVWAVDVAIGGNPERTVEMPALSFRAAEGIASANESQGHTSTIISRISFQSKDPWEVTA